MINHTETLELPKRESFPAVIEDLIARIERLEHYTPAAIRNIILDLDIQQEDLLPWADWDHPVEDSYGRKLLHDGGSFEVMVMSWVPGDFSAIHDHGYTQWGAVKTFGASEHATFLVMDGEMKTLSRTIQKPGQVTAVGHQLIHQMGNPSEERFLSLHVYGATNALKGITDDARVFDLHEAKVHHVLGGVFYGLTPDVISSSIQGPEADYPTWLRDQVEHIRRLRKIRQEKEIDESAYQEALKKFKDPAKMKLLQQNLEEHLDENAHVTSSTFWNILCWELKEAAKLQRELKEEDQTADAFNRYAELYDEVVGKPCLNNFMKGYWKHLTESYAIDLSKDKFLSIGCGTGLVEVCLLEEFGLNKENLLGIDISRAMVKVAQQYIPAEYGDALELDPAVSTWDIAYCGLNVFQYIGHQRLEEAIERVSRIVNPGGYFISDFITPDHIRWYPNVLSSEDGQILSLRTPKLIERENHMYQQSSIINLRAEEEGLAISYAGQHARYLPSVGKLRSCFERHFDEVDVLDAFTLKPIQKGEDTCPSTRYLVVARKR